MPISGFDQLHQPLGPVPGSTLSRLHRPSVDVLGAQGSGIQPMQCIDIDRCDLRPIWHCSVRETLYATRLAEHMCDSFLIESILREVVFAPQKLELRARRKCQDRTQGLTSRTVTRHAFIDIHFDFISHCTALASTIIEFLHFSSLQRLNRRSSQ